MASTLLLVPGFQTSAIALATLYSFSIAIALTLTAYST